MNVCLTFKVVMIGDSGVGKSCLLLQYKSKFFQPVHCCTIGADFVTRMIKVDDREVKLQIWDTSGQESFRAICPSYYRNAAGGLLVYDISRRESFENLKKWYEDFVIHANAYVAVLLIGNKSDLHASREVSTEEGEAFARDNEFFFMETSAKQNINVQDAFQKISQEIYNLILRGTYQLTNEYHGVQLDMTGPDTIRLPPRPYVPEKRRCCRWF